MADQNNAQLNADKKEVTTPQAVGNYPDDTEFATDTWMGAVFSPDATQANGNIMYDPSTQTERYLGPQVTSPKNTDLPAAQTNNNTTQTTAATQATTTTQTTTTSNYQNNANRRNDISNLTRYEMGTEAGAMPRLDARSDERLQTRSPVTGPSEARGDAAGGLGMVGLGLSLLSLFMLPYLLAPIGIVIGYLAMRRNAATLGTWAMIVGAIAILGALIVYPYFIAR